MSFKGARRWGSRVPYPGCNEQGKQKAKTNRKMAKSNRSSAGQLSLKAMSEPVEGILMMGTGEISDENGARVG